MSKITINHAKKIFNDTVVIEDLNLEIADGSLFTLLGPSGCGKTTLLRMIAGFNSIEGGEFYFGTQKINGVDPAKRNIGMVFQNYAIIPHLTVEDNVAFGLKQAKKDKNYIKEMTDKYLNLMQISEFRKRKPAQLSGGQQQRVALARALAINPDVLLMDEPLSNLDAKLRVDMREAIREIQSEVNITTVYVTHDQEEAMAISDQIAVMKKGEIQQVGSPKELYHRPKNLFVANFIGRSNIIPAKLLNRSGESYLEFNNGYLLKIKNIDAEEQNVKVCVRPEEFIRIEEGEIEGEILTSIYLGQHTEYYTKLPFAERVQVSEESTFKEDLKKKEKVNLKINIDKINIFSEDGLRNLTEEV